MKPFHLITDHPCRCLIRVAGGVIEDRSAGKKDVREDSFPVILQPAFLNWHSESKNDNVWPSLVDIGNDLFSFFARLVKITVVGANDFYIRKLFANAR